MTKRKHAPAPVLADPEPQGALILTLSLNRTTKTLSLAGNGDGLADLLMLQGALQLALGNVQEQLMVVAEARGRAAAEKAAA